MLPNDPSAARRGNPPTWHAPAPARRLKCIGGPLAGERHWLPATAAELAVPWPPDAAGEPAREAVYRLARRRRGRGPAFDVLVYAGERSPDPAAPSELPH